MPIWTAFRALMNTGLGLWRAREGNVTITFAVAFIPLMGLVGAAVDYSRANAIRTAMQSSVDAAALAVGKTAAGQTDDQIQTKSDNLFRASFTRTDVSNLVVTGVYTTTGGSKVTISASATMNTNFLGIVGIRQMQLGARSVSTWGSSRLRVALVLDNTGSMDDDGKIAALKTATKNLLTQLQNAAVNSSDVYVSIIPFVKDIAVDKTGYAADWIYWGTVAQDPDLTDDSSWDAKNGSCSGASGSTRSRCYRYACSLDGITSKNICKNTTGCTNPLQTTKSSCETQKACSIAYADKNTCEWRGGTWDYGTWGKGVWNNSITWTPNNHNTWNGCITDRGNADGPDAGDYDANTAAPTSSTVATLFPAEQYGACPKAVMPLNNNWTTMSTFVDSMSANGSTNQAIGMAHGWQSLVGGGPYPTPPAMDTNYTYKKVIILLSDGLNTQDRWYGDGYTTGSADDALIDAREQLACTNAKAAGITIYTVQVNTHSPADPTSTVLQNCASPNTVTDPGDKFFMLTSADAIVTTFQQIGTQISKLRIAQ